MATEWNVTDMAGTSSSGGGADSKDSGVSSASLTIDTLYVAIGSVGMVGNFFSLVVILSSREMRSKVTTWYIANQSAIDFGVSLMLVASAGVNSQVISGSGLAAEIYCRVWTSKVFLWGLLVSSTYNLIGVTLERYCAILHPVWHRTSFTRLKAAFTMALFWFTGIAFNFAYMIPTSRIKGSVCSLYSEWPSDRSRKAFGVITVFVQYIVPLLVIIFAYGRIAHKLTARVKVAQEPAVKTDSGQVSATGTGEKDALWTRARRNTIKTLASVALCFVLCWSCNQIYYMMMNLGYPPDYSSPFYHFTVIAVFLNSCINPIIYCLKFEQFQQAAKALFCRCVSAGGARGDSENSSQISTAE